MFGEIGQPRRECAARWCCLAFAIAVTASAARADPMPHQCVLSEDGLQASIYIRNTLAVEASCLANCKFSTGKFGDNPEMTCAKPVPAGKQVEMCVLTSSSGAKMEKLESSRGDCRRL